MALTVSHLDESRIRPVEESRPFSKFIRFSGSVAVGAPGETILETIYDAPTNASWVAACAPILSGIVVVESGRSATLILSVSDGGATFTALNPLWCRSGVTVITDLHLPAPFIRAQLYVDVSVIGTVDVSGYFTLRSSL